MGKRRSAAAAALTAALLLSGLVAAPTATAASSKLSIGKISTVTAPYGKKATIKPRVASAGKVKVLSKTLTVKQGKKTIARDRKAVKLAAGKYRATTKVKYRTYKNVSTTKTVSKKTVAVYAWTPTAVSCVATAVVPHDFGADFDADCTGAAFDGTRRVVGISAFDDGQGGFIGFAQNSDMIEYAATPAVGQRFAATLSPTDDLYKTRQVSETSVRKVWSKTKVKTRTQTLIVKAGKRPSRTSPNSWGECPKWAPVKGNQGSYDWIYHVPGSTYYSRTDAEECFVSAAAAKRAGYRAPLR